MKRSKISKELSERWEKHGEKKKGKEEREMRNLVREWHPKKRKTGQKDQH